jgi:hypothetical protein
MTSLRVEDIGSMLSQLREKFNSQETIIYHREVRLKKGRRVDPGSELPWERVHHVTTQLFPALCFQHQDTQSLETLWYFQMPLGACKPSNRKHKCGKDLILDALMKSQISLRKGQHEASSGIRILIHLINSASLSASNCIEYDAMTLVTHQNITEPIDNVVARRVLSVATSSRDDER